MVGPDVNVKAQEPSQNAPKDGSMSSLQNSCVSKHTSEARQIT